MSTQVAQGTPILEMARFTTRTADEEAFVAAHARAMEAVKRQFPSLQQVQAVKLDSSDSLTRWVDVAVWSSHEEADRAMTECMTIPEFQACLHFMVEQGTVEHGQVVAAY